MTITLLTIWARVCYSACAHVGWSTSSFPVAHFPSITWHPPGNLLRHKGYLIVALKFDKPFTVLWNSSKCCQLSSANPSVSHIFTITSWVTPFTSRDITNMGSTLTVVTYECHANSSLVTHITIHTEGSHASFAIRVNNIITWRASTAAWFYTATGQRFVVYFKSRRCLDCSLIIFCYTWVKSSIICGNLFEKQSSVWKKLCGFQEDFCWPFSR